VKLIFVKAVAAAVLIVSTSGAGAQAPLIDRGQMMDACGSDYLGYCALVRPGGGRIMNCLNEVIDQIAPACARLVRGGLSCMDDSQRLCAQIEQGDGRVQSCLLSNHDQLSAPCADILTQAATP